MQSGWELKLPTELVTWVQVTSDLTEPSGRVGGSQAAGARWEWAMRK